MDDLQLGPEGEFEKMRLRRLNRIQQADGGFFLLAVHSFVESWIRQKLHLWDESYSFEDLIFKYKISLINSFESFPPELSVLQTLRMKEKTAEAVKRSFSEISSEEARAAAYRLVQFCRLSDISYEEELGAISSGLAVWNERAFSAAEHSRVSDRISVILKENRNILDDIEKLNRNKIKSKQNIERIRRLEEEIARLRLGEPETEQLLEKKRIAEERQARLEKSAQAYASTENYIDASGILTAYTRTRLDFERDITRLTPEQQSVLDGISLKDDFLIKGGAGTGKTLVLIKALEKAARMSSGEFDFGGSPPVFRMLTFNRTLAKYDRYIARLLKQDSDEAGISTIDKFLYDKLRLINSDYRIIFDDDYSERLAEQAIGESSYDPRIIGTEIENYIFANGITEHEYLKASDKNRLAGADAGMRIERWSICGKMIKSMHDTGCFTKNYSRLVILEHLQHNPEDPLFKNSDFIFIDEVQDLSPVDIRAVKACCKRAVIMAGDSDQSIYRSGFSFSRAGIDIRGTTRILRTNFRNSIEIQDIAEKYRLRSDQADPDNTPEAFRTGPPPELHLADDEERMIGMILKKTAFFTETLDYDPENICILVPGSREVELLSDSLNRNGTRGGDLRTDEFSFSERNIIRISTMHSSKGLDFPVVLLMLNRLPQTSGGEGEERAKMLRNLIYVSMTRAMDHLNIFAPEAESSKEIEELKDCFSQETSGNQASSAR